MAQKIRIGYVLKSANVLTLVSRKYSENSSNTHTRRQPRTSANFYTHTCTPTPTHVRVCTPTHTITHPRTCMYTCTHLCTPVHTRAHMRTPAHTRAHPHTPVHTHTHPCIPTHTPHIPTDALNLINHMKLHVNGKMADRKKDTLKAWKKKEGTRVR